MHGSSTYVRSCTFYVQKVHLLTNGGLCMLAEQLFIRGYVTFYMVARLQSPSSVASKWTRPPFPFIKLS